LEHYSQPGYPKPKFHYDSVGHLLTNRVREVLEGLFRILRRQAILDFAPTSKIEVWGLANPEDESHTVVVTEWVLLPPTLALKHWDRVAVAIRAWTTTLPEYLAAIVVERVVVEVRWRRSANVF
jgi:hypothetical protein